MSITITPFGKDLMKRPVERITMTNKQGCSVSVTNYGAHVLSVNVPDRHGKVEDVCLGFDCIEDYLLKNSAYIGATVGRYCNRIGGAAFTLNGQKYAISANEGKNTLHGGLKGFDQKWWIYETTEAQGRDHIAMYYTTHDGEEGFPGKVRVQVVFTFDDANRLEISFLAQGDADTVINLTNHSYFNLAGSGDVTNHMFCIEGDEVCEVDEEMIATGKMLPVANTTYDLRTPRSLKDCLNDANPHPLFAKARGFDVNYALRNEGFRQAARVEDPVSGRVLTVETNQPGIQLYTGQWLSVEGKSGVHYGPFAGFALETQHFPNSVNHSHFPTTVLRAGESFQAVTAYSFSAE